MVIWSFLKVKPEDVDGFKEYGTKLRDGTVVSLSNRKGHALSADDARTINKKNYMNNWIPTYLDA